MIKDTQKSQVLPSFRLGFGAAAISGEGGGYGFGSMSESDAERLIHYAFERGIRIFDTAPIYGFGVSEKRLGLAIKNFRDQVFLVSKSGIDWHENKRVNLTNDPDVTARMLNESLKRLQCDYIDLYLVHWPDPRVDIRRPWEVLVRAKDQGKIRHLGLCNTNIEDLERAQSIAPVEVVQAEYSLVARENEKFFNYMAKHEIQFMSWGGLAKGILSGRVDKERKFDKHDARSWAPWWKAMNHEYLQRVRQELAALALVHGHSGLDLALGFLKNCPQVDCALVGMRTPEQIDSAIKSFCYTSVSSDLLERAKEISSGVSPS